MKILVDADGCPVVKVAIEVAKEHELEILVVKNYSHKIEDSYATIITVDNSSDSADYYIVNKAVKGDIVVTQDYGLCGMALAKGAICINQNGFIISDRNIDELLSRRHINRELRRKEGKYTKFKKRSIDDDVKFRENFEDLVKRKIKLEKLHLLSVKVEKKLKSIISDEEIEIKKAINIEIIRLNPIGLIHNSIFLKYPHLSETQKLKIDEFFEKTYEYKEKGMDEIAIHILEEIIEEFELVI